MLSSFTLVTAIKVTRITMLMATMLLSLLFRSSLSGDSIEVSIFASRVIPCSQGMAASDGLCCDKRIGISFLGLVLYFEVCGNGKRYEGSCHPNQHTLAANATQELDNGGAK